MDRKYGDAGSLSCDVCKSGAEQSVPKQGAADPSTPARIIAEKDQINRDHDIYEIRPIARIRTDFKEKFGIPRQARIVSGLRGVIEFEPEFRNVDSLRGIEEYSHLWLIWGFSANRVNQQGEERKWSPLVRPPRLGGSVKKGVFASRSPFRPNYLGMSVVTLLNVDVSEPANPRLVVGGADMLNGTPIYDIKPYTPYSDIVPEATSGYAVPDRKFIDVVVLPEVASMIPEDTLKVLVGVLEQDPRAAFEKKDNPEYIYGMRFADLEVKFIVKEGVLTVVGVEQLGDE